ncbi:MAG: RNA polymerase sigma factor region1.1 domain-containing protein, partial [Pyrinomonadaceae bacterium]
MYRDGENYDAKPAPADKTEDAAQAGSGDAPERDGPILDLSDQAVKKLIKIGKSRGYVTYDELNAVLPSEEFTSE